jgi:hypothetical protein
MICSFAIKDAERELAVALAIIEKLAIEVTMIGRIIFADDIYMQLRASITSASRLVIKLTGPSCYRRVIFPFMETMSWANKLAVL